MTSIEILQGGLTAMNFVNYKKAFNAQEFGVECFWSKGLVITSSPKVLAKGKSKMIRDWHRGYIACLTFKGK